MESGPQKQWNRASIGSLCAPPVALAVDPSALPSIRPAAAGAADPFRTLARMTPRSTLQDSWRAWFSHDALHAGPAWLHVVWTLVFSAVVALVLTAIGLIVFGDRNITLRGPSVVWEMLGSNLVVSIAIGLCIHALFAAGQRVLGAARIRGFGPLAQTVYYAGIPIAGSMIGWPLGLALLGRDVARLFRSDGSHALAGSLLVSVIITLVIYQFFRIKNRELQAQRRATEAQLKLLQGQIEPHFLFNTLANVVGLMESDTPRAKAMLEAFVDYLRSSLGGLRQASHTLGDELDLVEAYLRIVAIRMEERLRYRIDVPPSLREAPLPPLTLQPLVENAIVHGLEPKLDGGVVTVAARLDDGRLVVTVDDDGLGLAGARPSRGCGTACINIRERLLQSHGPRAELHIESAAPRGVRARLVVPLPT
jgi:hypothetical protein